MQRRRQCRCRNHRLNSSHPETKPLSGGSAEAARAPTRRTLPSWHAMDETAQPVEIAPPGGMQHGAGAEEQQRLEPGMVERVQERRRHRHRRSEVLAVGAKSEREPQRHEDHADVLDRRIGEHALEIAVEHGIEQAQHRRHRAEDDRRQRPPPGRRSEQVEGDAHEAVDGNLGHDAAHQRRHVTWRRRMGERQPGM
jgi:hypothetical protein